MRYVPWALQSFNLRLYSHTSAVGALACLSFDDYRQSSGHNIHLDVSTASLLCDLFVFFVHSDRSRFYKQTGVAICIGIVLIFPCYSIYTKRSRSFRTLKRPVVHSISLYYLAGVCRSPMSVASTNRFT